MAGNPYLWSTTAATNASADPDINFAEGQVPGSVNDSDRALMAGVAGWLKDTNSTLTTGGSANAQTVTSNVAYAALATGMRLHLKAGFTNTAACTLNLTPAGGAAFGAKAIKVISIAGEGDPGASQIRVDGHYVVEYDAAANAAAGAWILLNPSSNALAGLVLISSQTASSSSTLDFTTGLDSTYDEYLFTFTNILAATASVNFQLQISINAGSSWVTTSTYLYVYTYLRSAAGGTIAPTGSNSGPSVIMANNLSNSAANTTNGELRLFRPSSTTALKVFTWLLGHYDTVGIVAQHGSGVEGATTGAINGVRFAMTSGNIASGTIALYGVRKS